MANTRGNLAAATIYEVDSSGAKLGGGISVSCMFNPFEYTVKKTNRYKETPKNVANTPQGEFHTAGAQTLSLKLLFDSYEAGTDVSLETNKLWKFMQAKSKGSTNKQGEKIDPPQVAFEWGVFRFVAYLTSMTQNFILFKNDGTPVRAKVDVEFTQYLDTNDYPKQNPTSGDGPIERVWYVTAGDRLDTIAAEVYHDAAKWRLIASYNRLDDPLALRPGQYLRIPMD